MHKAIIRKENGKTFVINFICMHVEKEETKFFLENYPTETATFSNERIHKIIFDPAIHH